MATRVVVAPIKVLEQAGSVRPCISTVNNLARASIPWHLTEQDMENNPHYAPENLVDMLVRILCVKNDRQLAVRLNVRPSQICKVRKRRSPISAAFLINMHEETGLSLSVLRGLMGDFRENTGPSAKHPAVPPVKRLQELQRVYDLYRSAYLPLSPSRSHAQSRYAGAAN